MAILRAGDVSAMMTALTNISAYESLHSGFTLSDATFLLDVNRDGVIDNTDIQALISVLANGGLGGGSFAMVPEPGSILLLGIGGAILAPGK